jgi:hypothetical protein
VGSAHRHRQCRRDNTESLRFERLDVPIVAVYRDRYFRTHAELSAGVVGDGLSGTHTNAEDSRV